MRYTVRKSIVQIIGYIWMPSNVLCAQEQTLSESDLANIREYGDGEITREAIEQWITTHAGDFSQVKDFMASFEVGEETLDFPWAQGEDSEMSYCDAMYPSEDCA